jgi:hypothetical protein
MIIANISINLSKIDKSKIVEGKNGKYLNVTVSIADTKDKYDNDVTAWQQQTKEERDAKTERNFLGNGRKLFDNTGVNESVPNVTAKKEAATESSFAEDDNSLPF